METQNYPVWFGWTLKTGGVGRERVGWGKRTVSMVYLRGNTVNGNASAMVTNIAMYALISRGL